MTEKILGEQGTRRRRRFLWVPVVTIAALALLLVSGALAVHDLSFQLDGDVSASTQTHVPAGTTQSVDWDTLFDSSGATKTLPSGFSDANFQRDFRTNPGCSLTGTGTFCTADTSTFATGSKDTLNITPGWQCNQDANVNSKIDIMNAYAAKYTATNGDKILYFGMEKNKDNGTNDVAFWFLQSGADCVSTGGAVAWTGTHRDGDILVVSEFSAGGGVSTINAYRWNGSAPGSLGPTSIAVGVDCKKITGGEAICGTTNSGALPITGTITTPWLTSNSDDNVGHSLRATEFFEGGINLTVTNLADKCFNTFVGNTRSSTSLTATLFDYARGSIGSCQTTLVTTPSAASLSIGTGSVTATDSAVLNVTGATSFTGTLSFHLCGPIAAATPPTNCQTGGTAVAAAAGVNPVTANGTYSSAAATITSAGTYCWRANFVTTTTGVPNAADPSDPTSQTECFVVTPVTPTLTTSATGPVTLGNPIDDTAHLTGTATQPGTPVINPTTAGAAAGGTITFSLYGPSATAVCGTAIATRVVTVSGDGYYTASNGTGTGSLTPAAPGTYYWVAVYSGNLPNTLGKSGTCGDAFEFSVVTDTSSVKTDQTWVPNDHAQITSTGGSALAGSVVFTLYPGGLCAGTPLYTSGPVAVSGASPQIADSNNTTASVNASTTVSWMVVYTSNNLTSGSTSSCESTVLTIDNNPGYTPLP